MAKILDTVAAIEHAAYVRSEDHRVDPDVPHDIKKLHAVLLGPEPLIGAKAFIIDATEPAFLVGRVAEVVEAACGTRMQILLPEPFDSESRKACPLCLKEIGLKGE